MYYPFPFSTVDLWKTKIDARHNYWNYNISLAVGGRIRDRTGNIQYIHQKISKNLENFVFNRRPTAAGSQLHAVPYEQPNRIGWKMSAWLDSSPRYLLHVHRSSYDILRGPRFLSLRQRFSTVHSGR